MSRRQSFGAFRLTEIVTLSTLARTEDGQGGYTQTPTPLTPATVRAQVEGLRGQERMQVAGTEVTTTHRVVIRFHPQVDAHTRLMWGTRVLEVIGPPLEIGRRHLLELACAERVT